MSWTARYRVVLRLLCPFALPVCTFALFGPSAPWSACPIALSALIIICHLLSRFDA
jgi:hypothetical protein